jgi:hypothetical protein
MVVYKLYFPNHTCRSSTTVRPSTSMHQQLGYPHTRSAIYPSTTTGATYNVASSPASGEAARLGMHAYKSGVIDARLRAAPQANAVKASHARKCVDVNSAGLTWTISATWQKLTVRRLVLSCRRCLLGVSSCCCVWGWASEKKPV